MTGVCPHCGDAVVHETTVNATGQAIERDVCPRGAQFYSTAWTLAGERAQGVFTDTYGGQNYGPLTQVTVQAGGVPPAQHVQETASATWTIQHHLGRYPLVDLIDLDGRRFLAEIHHIDFNTTIVGPMGAPEAGKALLL